MNELVLFYPKGHEAHYEYGHPERPERIEVIRESLEQEGVWRDQFLVNPVIISSEILSSVHAPSYLRLLEDASKSGRRLDMDTYMTLQSWDLAKKAAGGAVAVARSVWLREAERGFALTRPPGHHATIDRGMGFCLINNVAVAAEYLFQEQGALRLAIVDLDLHHGNGTQDIFWDREDVLYVSTHQYPHYPGSGRLEEIGHGRAEGTTANFPMPPMSGDDAYKEVMGEIIIPLTRRFEPDMILVSYGFDTHWRDPLGNILLSANGYRGLIEQLVKVADEICQGRIAIILEGGYDLEAAVACTQAVFSALMDTPWRDPLGQSPQPQVETYKTMVEQAKYLWRL
jgi:acetoin utilization deacetylase AcuC-like enzyme